jgi:hypothetical protein
MQCVLAEAMMSGTVGQNTWFSAISIVLMSLNTQVHKGSYRGVKPYEDYYKIIYTRLGMICVLLLVLPCILNLGVVSTDVKGFSSR